MDRRKFLGHSALAGAAFVTLPGCTTQTRERVQQQADRRSDSASPASTVPAFEFDEISVSELQKRMTDGSLSSVRLTEAYLARMDEIDSAGPTLRSVIERNPDARSIAEALDTERKQGKVRGPLHGIPVLIKDNIDSADKMMTTAGSLALVGTPAPKDAFIVERLRAGGAVILGKTNLSEWANFRSSRSTSGWSGRGGQTRNPYVIDRNPCGSSSGTASSIAANLAAVGVGTETDGSIICPSALCGLVGLKPTVGLVSRSGIIPISASQDTAGPMGRTVADVAALLSAMTGEDSRDGATASSNGHVETDYTKFLDPNALKGARIGVARNLAGFHPAVDAVFETAIKALAAAGAAVVDPVDAPNLGKFDDAEMDVLLYEFKDGLNKYLAERGATVQHKSLAELMEYNTREAATEMPHFGQELFERAQKKGALSEAAYRNARALCLRLVRTEGLDRVFAQHTLDALVAPSNGPAWPTDHVNGDRYTGGNTSYAAISGYPTITVPMGFAAELPLGLSLIGTAWAEGRLIGLAHAFEQATKVRRTPRFLPSA
ncbi:MAG: amidase [Phycisphaerae bacterium]|nr:amidase [Gemmatimonadaceae bacterium]